VRSALEVDEVGKVKDSVNIPFVICTRVYDAQEGKKVIKKEDNTEWINQVRVHWQGGGRGEGGGGAGEGSKHCGGGGGKRAGKKEDNAEWINQVR
jgi:hypothetical protein